MKFSNLIDRLNNSYKEISFQKGNVFLWSPADAVVYYATDDQHNETEKNFALLHETAHGLLNHVSYKSDIQLLGMERDAWEEAKQIGREFGIFIDEDHVQDCLDSYRDWLHKRSLCPDCSLAGIQISDKTYSCIFCYNKWHVTSERFCRPYRKSVKKR